MNYSGDSGALLLRCRSGGKYLSCLRTTTRRYLDTHMHPIDPSLTLPFISVRYGEGFLNPHRD